MSFTRIYFIFKFIKNSNRFDFINLIYKYLVGRNFGDHSKKLMRGDFDKIDKLYLNKFLKFYKVNNPSLKFNFNLKNNEKVLIIKNVKN